MCVRGPIYIKKIYYKKHKLIKLNLLESKKERDLNPR